MYSFSTVTVMVSGSRSMVVMLSVLMFTGQLGVYTSLFSPSVHLDTSSVTDRSFRLRDRLSSTLTGPSMRRSTVLWDRLATVRPWRVRTLLPVISTGTW